MHEGDLTVARTRNPDGDFTLDLEEIEQNLKRAQELTRHFAELEESCWGGRLVSSLGQANLHIIFGDTAFEVSDSGS